MVGAVEAVTCFSGSRSTVSTGGSEAILVYLCAICDLDLFGGS